MFPSNPSFSRTFLGDLQPSQPSAPSRLRVHGTVEVLVLDDALGLVPVLGVQVRPHELRAAEELGAQPETGCAGWGNGATCGSGAYYIYET